MTESHLRRLSIMMRTLEDALLDMEAALAKPPVLAMTIYEDDVPHSMRAAVLERMGRLRDEIAVVKERNSLDPQIISNRGRILAKLSLLSIGLTEVTSHYLRGYGQVPREEQGPLDDQVMKVIDIVDELMAIVGRMNS
jgi:hypothetical protein